NSFTVPARPLAASARSIAAAPICIVGNENPQHTQQMPRTAIAICPVRLLISSFRREALGSWTRRSNKSSPALKVRPPRAYDAPASMVETSRITELNDLPPAIGQYVLYWMQASQRTRHNPAL